VFKKLVVGAVLIASLTVPSSAADKPLIGIGTDVGGDHPKQALISFPYIEAIEKAGGIPILLPPMPAEDLSTLLPKLDGLVLVGGMDYPPALYGEETGPKTQIMAKERSDFDLALSKQALADKTLPVLGICAGCQVLNIGGGGSLVQDIPTHFPESKVAHASKEGWTKGFNTHGVTFQKESRLHSIYGDAPLVVPTSHHQCVGKVGADFVVVGRTADGLPEAIEKPGDRFVVGVQFHPERNYEQNKPLFAEFIKQASLRHSRT
jgi:putative glutamine amidotransferase